MKKIALILGNGFDISLGLPTSYEDFVSSNIFVQECAKNNGLALYIHKQTIKDHRWIDLEQDLAEYASYLKKPDIVLREYHSLKNAVTRYYQSINEMAEIKKDSLAYQIVVDNYVGRLQKTEEQLLIVNFNYTNSVDKVLDHYMSSFVRKLISICELVLDLINIFYDCVRNYPNLNHLQTIHPHGDVNGHIILGVDDTTSVDECIFLKKSVDINFNKNQIQYELTTYDKIIIFGHSLGKSDHTYFKDVFMQQSESSTSSKDFEIYYYGIEDYYRIMKEIDTLTENRINKFRRNNNVRFIDSSRNDNTHPL